MYTHLYTYTYIYIYIYMYYNSLLETTEYITTVLYILSKQWSGAKQSWGRLGPMIVHASEVLKGPPLRVDFKNAT